MNFFFILIIKATLLMLLSALVLLIMQKASASFRHWLISLTLLGLLLLPMSVSFGPDFELEMPISQAMSMNFTGEQSRVQALPLQTQTESETLALSNFSNGVISKPSTFVPGFDWLRMLFIIWFVGVIYFIGRLLMGLITIQRLSKKSVPFRHPLLSSLVVDDKLLMNLKVNTPMTWGFFRPEILLPESAQYWSDETLKTVLLHESAHIKRGDYWVHVLSLISISLYWFHPLVWWMKKMQIREREKACDEYVLNAGLPGVQYAEHLISVARDLKRRRMEYVLPMAQLSELKQRVLAILKFRKENFRFTKFRQGGWAFIYVSIIFLLAAFTLVEPVKVVRSIDEDSPLIEMLEHKALSFGQPEPAITSVQDLMIASEEVKPIESMDSKLPPPALLNPKDFILNVPSKLLKPLPVPSLEKVSKKAMMGQFTKGKSQFRVWTYGDFRTLADFPYLEVESYEDMIIIEERRKSIFGNKTFRLSITRAPYDGGLVQEMTGDKIQSWQGGYKEGQALYFFTINDKWNFLGKDKLKWMADHLLEVWMNLSLRQGDEGYWSEIDHNNRMIQQQKQLFQKRFLPYGDLPENDFEKLPYWKNLKYLKNPPFDFTSVAKAPQKESKELKGTQHKVGRTKVSNTVTGGNALNIGQKFGAVIRNIPAGSLLKDFNFHLRENDFERSTFKMQLFSVDAQGIKYALTPEGINVEATDSRTWIRTDLEAYNIVAGGHILVLLELSHLEQKGGEGYIFFSQGKGPYYSFHNQTQKEWGFWEEKYAMYFTITR